MLDVCVFDIFKSANELFENNLRIFETCVLVSKCVCGESGSAFPIIFIDNRNVTPVLFFVVDFSFFICKMNNYMFILLHCIIFILAVLLNLLIAFTKHLKYLEKESKVFSFTSSRTKNKKYCSISCLIQISCKTFSRIAFGSVSFFMVYLNLRPLMCNN